MSKFDYKILSYLIDLNEQSILLNWKKIFKRNKLLEVEIGFGLGEVLVHNALEQPDVNYIGIEQNWERICKCLKNVIKNGDAENLKILKVDARHAFQWLFKEKSLHHVYSLFPCPWPKKSHIKHRLFSHHFLKLINNRLTNDGNLRIITDYYPYAKWVMSQSENTGFDVRKNVIKSEYGTKFEQKWKKEGQEEFFELQFKKIKHTRINKRNLVTVKSYKIKKFNPEKLQVNDIKDDVSIIHKDTVVDRDKNKILIHLIVSEKDITQHFWAIIVKKKAVWQINKVDGQTFFPTPGIARALEHIYKEALKTE